VKLPDLSDEELVGVWFHANAELHRPGPSCSSAFVSRSFGIGVGAGDGCPDLVGDSGDAAAKRANIAGDGVSCSRSFCDGHPDDLSVNDAQ
jgi:hypothetical protein